MRLVLVLLLAGCLRSQPPTVDHHIELSVSGLSSTGPATYRARADLDNRVLEISVPGDEITTPTMHTRGADKKSTKPLTQAEVDELRRLATAARHEELGPEPGVHDLLEELQLDGEPPKQIRQSQITGPNAKQLRQRLAQLAGF